LKFSRFHISSKYKILDFEKNTFQICSIKIKNHSSNWKLNRRNKKDKQKYRNRKELVSQASPAEHPGVRRAWNQRIERQIEASDSCGEGATKDHDLTFYMHALVL
jgi:hypothetical protein